MKSLPIAWSDHSEGAFGLNHGCDHLRLTAIVFRGGEPDSFANCPLSPRGIDLVHPWHLASNQVFERGIAVETAAVLADLADPGPDILWRRVDSNGMGDGSLRAEEEFISREGGGQFGAG